VDEPALVAALLAGRIAGAALDVMDAEQATSPSVMFGGKAIAYVPNLLVTPHVAGQTMQALLNVGTTAWQDIQAVISGNAPLYPFNTPTYQR
jgi:phosphoglycerate dehydrogenase-like enzyme